MAEPVDDPALIAEPLSRPGEVIKRLRGSAAEQLAAASTGRKAPEKKPRARSERKEKEKPKPRPSRAALEEAEQALDGARARHEAEAAQLAAREAELARERRAMEKRQRAELATLEKARDRAAEAYSKALARWQG